MTRLQDFDEKYVPGMATRYVNVRDRVSALRRRAHHTARHRSRDAASALLEQLDSTVAEQRWGVPARRPLVALLAAGTIFSVAIGVLILRPVGTTPDRAPAGGQTRSATYVGPQVGDDVSTYIAERNAELNRLAVAVPQGPTLAVVSFSRFTSIGDATKLLRGISTRRVFFGVPILGVPTEIGQSAVGDFEKDTREAFLNNSRARARLALTFGQFATAAPARTEVERQYKELYRRFAHNNETESRELATLCSCVIGAVVDATMQALLTLEQTPGVRIVDVAPADVPPNSLGFRPISPDETGTISAGTGSGQLNQIAPPR